MEVKDSWIQSIDYFSFCNNTLLTFLPDLHQEADFPDWARDIEELTTCTCKLLIKYTCNKNEYHK